MPVPVPVIGAYPEIEAVTASPAAIEGGRPKFIIRNETQNWDASNGGHDMAGAIGPGPELAVQGPADFKAKSKVIILLTDGESNVHDIDEDQAIEDAHNAGITVYTIGAGTTGVAPICADRGDGRTQLMQMGVSIDESLLRKIADKTGGQYFRATDQASLARIYKQIDKLQPTSFEENRFLEYHQFYGWFLGAGLVAIALALLLRGSILRRLP